MLWQCTSQLNYLPESVHTCRRMRGARFNGGSVKLCDQQTPPTTTSIWAVVYEIAGGESQLATMANRNLRTVLFFLIHIDCDILHASTPTGPLMHLKNERMVADAQLRGDRSAALTFIIYTVTFIIFPCINTFLLSGTSAAGKPWPPLARF